MFCQERSLPQKKETGGLRSTKLGSFADTLSSGGVVLGDRRSAAALRPDELLAATELFVNGERLAGGSGAAVPVGSELKK